jgi:hypothetical protein
MSAPAYDLFSHAVSDSPASAGLRRCARSAPAAWPADRLALWPFVVDEVTAFRRQWDERARAVGWDDLALYSLHPRAPYANLAAMGAAFKVALGGWQVIGVGADAIEVVSRTGSRLRIYRRAPDADAVLAWAPADVR